MENKNENTKKREILLITKQNQSSVPTLLDNIERISKIFALIIIPLIVAFSGWVIQQNLSEKNVNKDYVSIAVKILSDPNTSKDRALRSWAVDLLNATSPTKMSKEIAKSLRQGDISFPKSLLQDASTHSAIGRSYAAEGDYEQALINFEKALSIRAESLGSAHPETIASYNNIGSLMQLSGQYIKAESYYLRALGVQKQLFGNDAPQLKSTLANLLELYTKMGDTEKSAKIRSELGRLINKK